LLAEESDNPYRLNAFNPNPTLDGGGAWVRGVGMWDRVRPDTTAGSSGFNSTTTGIQAGLDTRWNDDALLGVSVAYTDSRVSYDDNAANGNTRTFQGGVYGQKTRGDWRVNGALAYSQYRHHSSRTVVGAQAVADYDARALSAHGEAATRYDLAPGWRAEPSLGANLTWYAQDGYAESGAAGANLAVAALQRTSLQTTLQNRWVREIRNGDTPKGEAGFTLGWRHEWGSLDNTLKASFAAAPTAGGFSTSGGQQTRDALLLGAGASLKAGKQTQWFADWQGAVKKEQISHLLMAGVRVGF
jgi:uncharacterized protein with beta-barrel porin domain